MDIDKLLLENLRNTKTAVTCSTKDEWYQIFKILSYTTENLPKPLLYDLNVIPGLIRNTISLGTPFKTPLFSLREKKSYFEDNGFTIINAADFIEANTPAVKPQNEEAINKEAEIGLVASEPVKEKVVIAELYFVGEKDGSFRYNMVSNKMFPDFSSDKIKQAIESALNDTVVEDDLTGVEKHFTEKKYSQSEVDALRSHTWRAAREWNGRTKKDFYWFMYPELSDYLSSLNLNTKDTGKEQFVRTNYKGMQVENPIRGYRNVPENAAPGIDTGTIKPASEENGPKTKFFAGHEYIVRCGGSSCTYIKVKILQITQKCYNVKFENASTNYWDSIVHFENTHDLVEDITSQSTIFLLEHGEVLIKIFREYFNNRKR